MEMEMEMTMDEARFWEIVDTINWASDCDYKRGRKWFLQNLTFAEVEAFRSIKSEKWNALDEMIGMDRNPAGGGDDSHSDLLNHVIGLGKEQYEAHLADYSLLEARGNAKYDTAEGYKESFAYCLPHDDDYAKLESDEAWKEWAQRAIEDYQGYIEKDTFHVLPETVLHNLRSVIAELKKVREGKLKEFMAGRKEGTAAVMKIDQFFDDNWDELPRKFDRFNRWQVTNLYSDLEDFIAVKA
jgi:hypothetical protein